MTMKCLFVLLFAMTFLTQGQLDKNVERLQLQLSVPLPSVLLETAMYKNITTSIEAIAGFPLQEFSSDDINFNVYPVLRGQLRYYHNMRRRLEKKKNISGNSGNYIAALLTYQHGHALIGKTFTGITIGTGPVYGIQRAFGRGLFYRFEGGVVYRQSEFNEGISLVLTARLGWTFRKKTRK